MGARESTAPANQRAQPLKAGDVEVVPYHFEKKALTNSQTEHVPYRESLVLSIPCCCLDRHRRKRDAICNLALPKRHVLHER